MHDEVLVAEYREGRVVPVEPLLDELLSLVYKFVYLAEDFSGKAILSSKDHIKKGDWDAFIDRLNVINKSINNLEYKLGSEEDLCITNVFEAEDKLLQVDYAIREAKKQFLSDLELTAQEYIVSMFRDRFIHINESLANLPVEENEVNMDYAHTKNLLDVSLLPRPQLTIPEFPVKKSVSSQRRKTIKQRYFSSNWEERCTPKQAAQAMLGLGMNPSEIDLVIKHWDNIQSSSGPRSLAEWKLYERAKKLRDGGFSYRDAVGVLARDAGVNTKRVKDVIGTSEEWHLGYYDDGLQPLDPAIEEDQKRQVKVIKDHLKKEKEQQALIESHKAGVIIDIYDLMGRFDCYVYSFEWHLRELVYGPLLSSLSNPDPSLDERVVDFTEGCSKAHEEYLEFKDKFDASPLNRLLRVVKVNNWVFSKNETFREMEKHLKVLDQTIHELNQALAQLKYEVEDFNQMFASCEKDLPVDIELLVPLQR